MSKGKSYSIGLFFLCSLIACLFWWPATHAEPLIYDDPVFIGKDSKIHGGLSTDTIVWSFQHVGTLNLWHPLTWISFLAEVSLFGSSAHVHHATNVLLHALNAGLFALLARALRLPLLASLVVGLLFALHPSGAQSLMWISERKGLLATLFTLCSLLSWNQLIQGRKAFGLLCIACATAALLSKPSAVILPGLLVLQTLYTKEEFSFKKFLSPPLKAPLIITSGVSILVALITLTTQKQGGLNNLANESLLSRIASLPTQAQIYTETLVGSSNYRLLHPITESGSALAYGILLTFVGMLFYTFKKHRQLFFLCSMGLLPLALVSGIITVGEYTAADRYIYLSRGFFWISLFVALSLLWKKASPLKQHLLLGLFATLLLLPTYKSKALIERYSSSLSLFKFEAAQRPSAIVAHLQKAHTLKLNKQPELALQGLSEALTLHPNNGPLLLLYVDLLYQQKQYDLALATLLPHVRAEQQAHLNFYLKSISLLCLSNRTAEANAVLLKATKYYPTHPKVIAAKKLLSAQTKDLTRSL